MLEVRFKQLEDLMFADVFDLKLLRSTSFLVKHANNPLYIGELRNNQSEK